ncbi:hypothetical protein GA0070614_0488 [Micromonospora coxensis]|uniref:Helix-turn-helix domain-containing protein n=1 Tax=Micromonospora coxensis TaxID=356852 RepID=A0A1C5GWP4_9ACTN|nr:hypothetical protein GA0070614_0488 [Micromonospora coxensis]
MTVTHEARYCRCGTRLARDNITGRCSPCASYSRQQPHVAPDVPADFWDEVVLKKALQSRHMGRVIRAWRTHPHHGQHPISQGRAASWVGMSQAQLSRVETGPPIAHLDRLVQWATVLRIPADRLWFAMPATAGELNGNENEVNRRQLFATAVTAATSSVIGGRPAPELLVADREAVEWFAWHLWQHRKDELEPSQIPGSIASRLNSHPHVLRTVEGSYRFTDPALTDVLVAHRVFGDIAQGSGHLLATAQTSHATDLTISALAADDEGARRGLTAWMRTGATAVLRVNSAGILAKVGVPELGDAAICAIRADQDARHLYLTAVASRVLGIPWAHAAQVASEAVAHAGRGVHVADGGATESICTRLASELANGRDAAARWCSAVLLANCGEAEASGARAALMSAVQQETCRENLRAYAAVLAGITP